ASSLSPTFHRTPSCTCNCSTGIWWARTLSSARLLSTWRIDSIASTGPRVDWQGYMRRPNAWRDALKPTEILKKLCQESRLDGPHFEKQKIRIGNIIYEFKDGFGYGRTRMENMALNLLHRWKEISPGKYSLVPEHLETRTLYHPRKPAEPQVKTFIFVEIHNYNKICFIINFDFVEVCLSCDILTHNTSVAEFRNLMKHSMSYK
ncbi:fer-1-like protein 6, partial [Trichonephila clavata]